MTEIEEKALALVNAALAARGKRPYKTIVGTLSGQAVCLAIERHEADKKAFSEAVREALDVPVVAQNVAHILLPFILPEPEPDPLVEIAREMTLLDGVVRTDSQKAAIREGRAGSTASDDFYDRLRMALPARGYKIERIDHD